MASQRMALLLVEGRDDREVIYQLCNYHHVDNRAFFEVKDLDGVENLLDTVGPTARSGVPILGVVVDADVDIEARWAALTGRLSPLYDDFPKVPSPGGLILTARRGLARLGIWVMPDNSLSGMLEDLLLTLAPSTDPLRVHADLVLDTLPQQRFSPAHRSKALLHTYLAWQKPPGLPMGLAITERVLRADGPQVQPFLSWLKTLFQVPNSP